MHTTYTKIKKNNRFNKFTIIMQFSIMQQDSASPPKSKFVSSRNFLKFYFFYFLLYTEHKDRYNKVR